MITLSNTQTSQVSPSPRTRFTFHRVSSIESQNPSIESKNSSIESQNPSIESQNPSFESKIPAKCQPSGFDPESPGFDLWSLRVVK